MQALGLDFGTTNSAVAAAGDSGVKLARFPSGRSTFRSVLYFDSEERGPDRKPLSIAGEEGIERYLAEEATGRLIQSMKSWLASRRFTATQVFSSVYTLEDLIARLAKDLAAAAQKLGDPASIVVGRPVRFAGVEEPSDEEFALGRLKSALGRAGFGSVRLELEYEPVAAAYHYESGLDRDENVLIADFGGGTSDFSVVRVGPAARARGTREILAVDGVALAGDAFDGRIVRHLVAPELGRGGSYVTLGKEMPVPPWLHAHLERWHHLSFLKSKESMALIDKIEEGSSGAQQKKIEAFRALVNEDLGFHLARAVERTKVELSAREKTTFVFEAPGVVSIKKEVRRGDFEKWIEPELDAIRACVDRILAATKGETIDKVFMTGGSSLVPAVRRIFAERFGEARLKGGDELTSVASGLALVARDRFR